MRPVASLTSPSSAARRQRAGDPLQRRARAGRRRARPPTRSHQRDVGAGRRERRGDAASRGRRRGRRASRTARPRGRRAPTGRAPASPLDLAAQRVERDELLGGDRCSARGRASEDSRGSVVACSASTARVAAEAGLLISCARPADSVPRATSASRWRAVDSIRRTVLTSPSMKCTPEREPLLRQAAQTARRARRSTRPGSRRARWRSRRRTRPTPRSRRPTGRARSCSRAPTPRCRPGASGAIVPSSSTHQTSAGRPSWKSVSPGVEARSSPEPASELGELGVVEAVEERERAQLRERPSDARQVAVHEVDRHRALADGGGDPLHRVEPHVTGGEDPGMLVSSAYGGRGSGQRRRARATQQVGAGDDEPRASRATASPSQSVRGRAPMKTNSQLVGSSLLGAGVPVGEGHRLQVAVAVRRDDLGAEPHLDVVGGRRSGRRGTPTWCPRDGPPGPA